MNNLEKKRVEILKLFSNKKIIKYFIKEYLTIAKNENWIIEYPKKIRLLNMRRFEFLFGRSELYWATDDYEDSWFDFVEQKHLINWVENRILLFVNELKDRTLDNWDFSEVGYFPLQNIQKIIENLIKKYDDRGLKNAI